jgi:hypothetical protein
MPSARVVDFRIRRGHEVLVDGEFSAVGRPVTTWFGARIRLLAPVGAHGAKVAHHLLPDGSVSFSLTLFAGRKTVLEAGVAMGSESGERGEESVMLGPEHELVFRTRTVP